jgi:hypothetical protein
MHRRKCKGNIGRIRSDRIIRRILKYQQILKKSIERLLKILGVRRKGGFCFIISTGAHPFPD